MSTLIDLAIFPLDKGASVSRYVARAAALIKGSGLPFAIGPMGTSIEGEWTAVMAVVSQCMASLQQDCDRIYCTVKVDYRKGASGRIQTKVDALAEQIG